MIHQEQPCFTSARMRAAEAAKGEYIFCVDSHVLFGQNLLKDSISFMDSQADNDKLGFGHPPIRWAHQGPKAVRHTLKMAANGTPWGEWDRGFITHTKMFWKFMPWICRRDWYLNTLKGYGSHSDYNVSWGGAEMLQQVKSLMLGYENWAIVTDPLIHIGPYTPDIVNTGQYKYRTYSENGNFPHGFGVLLAFAALGGSSDGYKHAKLCEDRIFNRHHIKVDDYWQKALELSNDEYNYIQNNKKYGYIELLTTKPWLK